MTIHIDKKKILIGSMILLLGAITWWLIPHSRDVETAEKITSNNCIAGNYSVGNYQIFHDNAVVPFAIPQWFHVVEKKIQQMPTDHIGIESVYYDNSTVCLFNDTDPDAYSGPFSYKEGKLHSLLNLSPLYWLVILYTATFFTPILFTRNRPKHKILNALLGVYFMTLATVPFIYYTIGDLSYITTLLLFLPAIFLTITITYLTSPIVGLTSSIGILGAIGLFGLLWLYTKHNHEKGLQRLGIGMYLLSLGTLLLQSIFPYQNLLLFFILCHVLYAIVFLLLVIKKEKDREK